MPPTTETQCSAARHGPRNQWLQRTLSSSIWNDAYGKAKSIFNRLWMTTRVVSKIAERSSPESPRFGCDRQVNGVEVQPLLLDVELYILCSGGLFQPLSPPSLPGSGTAPSRREDLEGDSTPGAVLDDPARPAERHESLSRAEERALLLPPSTQQGRP